MASTERASQNLSSSKWVPHYTQGLVLLVGLAALVRLSAAIVPGREVTTLWEWVSASSDRWVLAAATIIVLPASICWTARRFVHPHLARRRGWGAFFRFEHRLVTELEPVRGRGAQTVIVNWPSAEVATVDVLAATSVARSRRSAGGGAHARPAESTTGQDPAGYSRRASGHRLDAATLPEFPPELWGRGSQPLRPTSR